MGTGKHFVSSVAKWMGEKESMEKMWRRESAGKENSNKAKKVLAHQSFWPAVGGDISLVHFVNREIVCRESGWVWVTRKDRDTQRRRNPMKTTKRAQSFFIRPFLIPASGHYRHCDYRRDERVGGCPSSILSLYQSSTLRFLPPADVTSPAHVSFCLFRVQESCRSSFPAPANSQIHLKENHRHNDSCHFP